MREDIDLISFIWNENIHGVTTKKKLCVLYIINYKLRLGLNPIIVKFDHIPYKRRAFILNN